MDRFETKKLKKIINPFSSAGGYLRAGLFKDNGVRVNYSIHRIVYKTFHDDFDEKNKDITVDHIDFNPSNNHLDNLRLINRSDISRSRRTGILNMGCRKMVEQYSLDGDLINIYESALSAALATGLGQGNISVCCLGQTKQCGGYVWKYIKEKDIDGEEWKTIIVNEASIRISNMGRIKSKNNKIGIGSIGTTGYRDTKVNKKHFKIHNLVALAFLPARPNDDCIVNHINENKEDNRAGNLQWVTKSQNTLHSGYKHYKPLNAICVATGEIKYYVSVNQAVEDLGISRSNISKVCYGERKKTCGYVFRFVE